MTTSILQIKEVKKGECVGYGATYTAEEDIKIAVLPIGYNNGIGRRNAGRYVVINGKKYFAVRLIDPTSNLQQQQHQGNDKLTDEYHFLSSGFLRIFPSNGIYI